MITWFLITAVSYIETNSHLLKAFISAKCFLHVV